MPRYLITVLEQVVSEKTYVVAASDEHEALKAFDRMPQVVRVTMPPYKKTNRKAMLFADTHKVSAEQLANAIRPAPKQDDRKKLLRILLGGEKGKVSKASMIALSKTLNKAFPDYKSPLDFLIGRNRAYNHDGTYKGVVYVPTPLTKEVYRLVRDDC